jgi:DnaK suppressor protein
MLNVDQLIDLEILAQEELSRLIGDEQNAAEDVAPISPDNAIGRLSRMDSMQIQEIAKDAQRRRERRIQDLKRALERMDAGTYGICERCSNWIEFERLEASPESTACGTCPPG